MGQQPYNWPTPDGYPDALDAWGDSLYPRWDFAHKALEGKLEGCKVEIASVFEPVGGFDRQRGAQLINQVLTGGTLTAEDEADVQAFLDEHDSIDDTVVKEALALAACSPSYQYY